MKKERIKKEKPAQRPPETRWVEKNFNAIFYSIAAGAALLYALLNPQYQTGVYNDDAIFVLGARNLLNSSFHSLLIKPDYPLPALPLLLAPFTRWVAPNWTSLEWLAVLVTALSVLLLGKWVRTWLSAGETMAVVALFAFNPLTARFSGILMAACFYTAAAIASFLLVSELLEKPSVKGALALGFIVGWGSLVRPEGVLLLISVAVTLALSPRGRGILRIGLFPIAGWLILLWYWFRMRQYPGTEYGGDVTALASYWTHHLALGAAFSGRLLQILLVKAVTGSSMSTKPAFMLFATILLCLGVAGLGFRSVWRERYNRRYELIGIALFCGLYGLTHLFWHAADVRYAIPLLPFVLIFLVRGLNELLSSVKEQKAWGAIILTLLLMIYAAKNGQAVYQSLWSPDPMKIPPWQSLAWLRQHTPVDANVISNIAPTVELYTDRHVIVGVPVGNIEMHLYELLNRKVSYLVDRRVNFLTLGVAGTEDPNLPWARVHAWMASYPEHFHLVFGNSLEQTFIYQITYDPGFGEAYKNYRVAAQAYMDGHYDQALRKVQDLSAIYPDLGSAANLEGALYLGRSDVKNAERAFRKAIELMPDSPAAMVNLASVYQVSGHAPLAEEYLRKALAANMLSADPEVFVARIQALRQQWTQRHVMIFLDPF